MVDYLHTRKEDLSNYNWDEYFESDLWCNYISKDHFKEILKVSHSSTTDYIYKIILYDDSCFWVNVRLVLPKIMNIWGEFIDITNDKLSTDLIYKSFKYAYLDNFMTNSHFDEISELHITEDDTCRVEVVKELLKRFSPHPFKYTETVKSDGVTISIATK